MKQQSNIIVQQSNKGISRIKLNQPNTYNALSLNMLKLLINSFKNLNDDEQTKVIIIEGSGKGFSAGHDLKEVNSLKNKTDYQKLFKLCSELMLNIVNNNKPVIAKVQCLPQEWQKLHRVCLKPSHKSQLADILRQKQLHEL